MSERVRLSHQAETDLEDLFAYYFAQGGEALAARFLAAFDRTRELLAQHPSIGSWRGWLSDRFQQVRVLAVRRGFRNILLLYELTDDGALILRVIHGVRDLSRILENEEQD